MILFYKQFYFYTLLKEYIYYKGTCIIISSTNNHLYENYYLSYNVSYRPYMNLVHLYIQVMIIGWLLVNLFFFIFCLIIIKNIYNMNV